MSEFEIRIIDGATRDEIEACYYPATRERGETKSLVVLAFGLTPSFNMHHPGLAINRRVLNMHGYAVATFNYRGAGEKSRYDFYETTMDMRTHDLARVIKCFSQNCPVDVVGHSSGGANLAKLCGQQWIQDHIRYPILSAPAAYIPSAWSAPFGDPFNAELTKRERSWLDSHEFKAFADFPRAKGLITLDGDDKISEGITERYRGSENVFHEKLTVHPLGHMVYGCYGKAPERIMAFAEMQARLLEKMHAHEFAHA